MFCCEIQITHVHVQTEYELYTWFFSTVPKQLLSKDMWAFCFGTSLLSQPLHTHVDHDPMRKSSDLEICTLQKQKENALALTKQQ